MLLCVQTLFFTVCNDNYIIQVTQGKHIYLEMGETVSEATMPDCPLQMALPHGAAMGAHSDSTGME